MPNSHRRWPTWVAAAFALFLGACIQPASMPGAPGPGAEPIVVYVVRHAERADGTDDPPISPAGEQRAVLLAETLRDAGLTHIYTTDFLRTRQTVAPIAEEERLEPLVYDGVGDLADLLRATPGRHLVVGHSNTVPALVADLGGESHGSIGLDEYDRFYVLTLSGGRTVTSFLRFGAR